MTRELARGSSLGEPASSSPRFSLRRIQPQAHLYGRSVVDPMTGSQRRSFVDVERTHAERHQADIRFGSRCNRERQQCEGQLTSTPRRRGLASSDRSRLRRRTRIDPSATRTSLGRSTRSCHSSCTGSTRQKALA